MKNKSVFLIICSLLAGAVFAQDGFETVEEIMNELMNYKGPQISGDEAPAQPAVDTGGVTAEMRLAETPVAQETMLVADPVETGAAASVPKQSPPAGSTSAELAFEGDFADALQGLAELIKQAPDSPSARLYLRTLLERDQRTAEISGMDAVDAAWSTDMVLRPYKLTLGAAERMKLGDITGPVDVDALFPQVDFPKGSSAIYQPQTDTVFIYNTSANLALLDSMLETMGVLEGFNDAEQVEIEAKFVEVSEGTLEELGFQWNLADGTQIGAGGSDLDINDGDSGLFSSALRGSPGRGIVDEGSPFPGDEIYGFVPGSLPFGRTPSGDGAIRPGGDWSSFRFIDTFNSEPAMMGVSYRGGDAFDVLISALDQSSGADVLSAPRVLTRSGEEATIQVGEIHYFPEVYESDASQATMVHVAYEDFTEKLLGVELTVTPKVTDKNKITLQLNPRITELAGWQSYQLAPADYIYGYYQEFGGINSKLDHEPVVASLPIYKRREIDTQVTIADGSTIGMGGLINEKIEAFEDRVPVLGSLPLIGRLFRNEGERAVKRNLLMFVTAKVVEPNGRISTARSFE